jgi:hypothetical protein
LSFGPLVVFTAAQVWGDLERAASAVATEACSAPKSMSAPCQKRTYPTSSINNTLDGRHLPTPILAGAIDTVLIARDAVTLRLWEVTYGELPVVLFGALVGLVEVAVVSLSVYGLVHAIGWVIAHFRAA